MENFGKQLGKTFNSTTVRGRANVAKATYGAFALIYLYFRMTRSSRKKKPEISPDCLKNCPACPPVGDAGSAGDAASAAAAGAGAAAAGAGAGAGAAAAAAGAAAGSAGGSNGKTVGAAKPPPTAKETDKSESGKGTKKNNTTTAGEEPRKPCKRVEPKQFYDT